MRVKNALTAALFVLLLIGASCGGIGTNGGENYGNLLDSPGGLILTQGEHPAGWGRTDCTSCHELDNIHLVNRTGLDIDIAAIHDLAVSGGEAGCPDCHGANGVE